VTCTLCKDKAVALFEFSHGCACDDSRYQYLCTHHAFKSRSRCGGTMVLIEDLTVDGAFTRVWAFE